MQNHPQDISHDSSHSKRTGRWLVVLGVILVGLYLACAALVQVTNLRMSGITRARVEGSAMEPSLSQDDFVLIDKLAYVLTKPARGDIIMHYLPSSRTRMYVKRIVGLPGERVTISQGKVAINGVALNEPYLSQPAYYSTALEMRDDEYFVLGDNRNYSSDSHSWGALPANDIIGKVVFVYWPPGHWGRIAPIAYEN
jgi:signal peptidase I